MTRTAEERLTPNEASPVEFWKCPEHVQGRSAVVGVHDFASLKERWSEIPSSVRGSVLVHEWSRLYTIGDDYREWLEMFREVGYIETVRPKPKTDGAFLHELRP